VWHAKNCRLIPPAEAERLAAGSPRNLLAHLEGFEPKLEAISPATVSRDLPERASPLLDDWATTVVLRALDADLISAGRAREILTWD
jgi:hypothetical protein